MSVNTMDYEEGFQPKNMEPPEMDKTKEEEAKIEQQKSEHKFNGLRTAAWEKAKETLQKKLDKEAIKSKVSEIADKLTSTALAGLCNIISLPPNFIEMVLAKEMEYDKIKSQCEADIACNQTHIDQYNHDIIDLQLKIDDYDKKAKENEKAKEYARSIDPLIPEYLIDYPYYLDETVREKWIAVRDKYIGVRDKLVNDIKELKDKLQNLFKDIVERAKDSAIGRKIKDHINTLKSAGTRIIKGVQLLVQDIITLFTECIGAAVVAMGSGVVVSPSPTSIISSKQKLAASAQTLGAAITEMMVAAAELGLDGSIDKDYGMQLPNVPALLEPFAISLSIVATLA